MEDKISQIRVKFELELDMNANPPYHSIDIERVRSEDWQIRRYLIESNGDVNEAYRNLIRTLEWKQSFGVHRFTESYFPTEFYQLYRVEKYGFDQSGRPIFAECFTQQRHFNELDLAFKQLVAVSLEQMDRIAGEKGMVYLGDFTNTPIHSLDVGLARFRVDVLNKHYPLLAKRIVLNNVPFLLRPILRFIVSFMKTSIKEAVVYTNNDQLTEYIDRNNLHRELNGDRDERHYPEGTVSFRICYARFSVKPAFVDYYFRYNHLD